MADGGEKPPEETTARRRSVRKTSLNSFVVQRNAKIEKREKVKKVSDILRKPECERTVAEKALVKKLPDIVKASQNNAKRLQANKDRVLEIEDQPEDLMRKCDELAELISNSSRIVVYTGAGISTAASIPDYRGPNGVWTLLKKGQELSAQDLSDAEPTFTHMSITKLFRTGRVKHVVSQNCDGLHIRSGYPRYTLSEVHGNMFIECCYNCEPHREYIRLFDVTEQTGVRRHTTSRKCRACGKYLTDTIVHFGEKGKIKSPYRWKEAVRAAKSSDLILCLGSSLKILRRYTCLWCMDKKLQQRPKLVIVNLQWTPKDDNATLKISGRCDDVMKRVMEKLEYNVPEYRREFDPIFKFCTSLRANEKKTTNKKILVPPSMPSKASVKAALAKSSKSKKKSRQSTSETEDCSYVSSDSKSSEITSTAQSLSNESSVKEEKEDPCLQASFWAEKLESNSHIAPVGKEDVKPIVESSLSKEIKSEIIDIKVEEIDEMDVTSSQGSKEEEKGVEYSSTNLNESGKKDEYRSTENKNDILSIITKTEREVTPIPSSLNHSTCMPIASGNQSIDMKSTPLHNNQVFLDQLSSRYPVPQPWSKDSIGQSLIDRQPAQSFNYALPPETNKLAPNSSPIKKSGDLFGSEVSSSAKEDSIGVLLVSQPPENLTDVCSLDLNSENPSVFPVCRIELPAVDETILKDDVVGKEDGNSYEKAFEDVVEDGDDVDLSIESNDAPPSTVVIDLEMMGSSVDMDTSDTPSSHPSLFGTNELIMVDLDIGKWPFQRPVHGNTTSIPSGIVKTLGTTSTSSFVLDLNKNDLQRQTVNNTSPHKMNDTGINWSPSTMQLHDRPSFPPSTMQLHDRPSFPQSASSSSNTHSIPLNSKSLSTSEQQKKAILPLSVNLSEGSKDHSRISLSSTTQWPSSKSHDSQVLPSHLATSQSSAILSLSNVSHMRPTPISLNSTSSTLDRDQRSFVSDSSAPKRSSFAVSSLSPSPANVKRCSSLVNEPGYPSPLKVNRVETNSNQFTGDLKEKQFRNIISTFTPSSTPSSSSTFQIPCHVSKQGDNVSKLSSSILSSQLKAQFIPNFHHSKCDPKIGSNNNSEKILEILTKTPVTSNTQTNKTVQESSSRNLINHIMKKSNNIDNVNFYNGKSEVCDRVFAVPKATEGQIFKNHGKILENLQQLKSMGHTLKREIFIDSHCGINSSNVNTVNNLSSMQTFDSNSLKLCVRESIKSDDSQHERCLSGHGNVFGNTSCSSSQVCPVPKIKGGVPSYILNMDDLLAPKSFLPSVSVSGTQRNKIPVDEISDSSGDVSVSTGMPEHRRSNVSLLSANAQERAFSPESQKPHQATSLVSKVTSQGDSLESSIIMSENTDIPFKDSVILDTGAQTTPLFVDETTATKTNTAAALNYVQSQKHSGHVQSRRPSGKRCHGGRGAIVLKADWGTPLTAVLQQHETVNVKKPKICVERQKTVKHPRPSSQQREHSYNNLSPPAQRMAAQSCDIDLKASGKKKAKKTQTSKLEKGVPQQKKKTAKPNKRPVATKTKKNTNPVASSLPGWFGKGLAIKVKRKKKC